jgi:methylated-DNA-[protein]-cysteine S-methyltransferase
MAHTATTYWTTVGSPIGTITITGDEDGVRSVWLDDQAAPPAPEPGVIRDDERLSAVTTQLREYFAGERRTFDLTLNPAGTLFQVTVWRALQHIPYGETVSYGELAQAIGKPGAARAVGLANGRNPIAIIVPCHRVIGRNGTLTGYGGGVDRKAWLLDHEAGRWRL